MKVQEILLEKVSRKIFEKLIEGSRRLHKGGFE